MDKVIHALPSMTDVFKELIHQPDELVRALRGMGLSCDGAQPVVTPLSGGVSSSIARIQMGSESYCLKQPLPQLRVAKEWLVPVDRVYAEIDWLRTAEAIVPGHVPHVIGVDEATNSFVMEFLSETFVNWKHELIEGRIDSDTAAQLGALLGRIHGGTCQQEQVARRFAHDAHFHALRLDPYFEEAGRQHPAVAPALHRLVARTRNTRLALVHGDVSPKNVLIGAAGPVLLDAECACYGDPAFDVAFCLNHFLLKAAWAPTMLPALFESFEALLDGHASHITWEAAGDLAGRIATLLPALLLARIDGKSPVEYLDDNARERVRIIALRLLAKPTTSLSEITTVWTGEFGL